MTAEGKVVEAPLSNYRVQATAYSLRCALASSRA
jgi:hypothetical protein